MPNSFFVPPQPQTPAILHNYSQVCILRVEDCEVLRPAIIHRKCRRKYSRPPCPPLGAGAQIAPQSVYVAKLHNSKVFGSKPAGAREQRASLGEASACATSKKSQFVTKYYTARYSNNIPSRSCIAASDATFGVTPAAAEGDYYGTVRIINSISCYKYSRLPCPLGTGVRVAHATRFFAGKLHSCKFTCQILRCARVQRTSASRGFSPRSPFRPQLCRNILGRFLS